ncbi:SDR family NAD(P)-dependent oxidoreductase [Streptosporangium sp. CA-115845]|uniref:SDR family NAD(P)-dependent oxidoreductase n=1 Tax=Streptosporangium sp. CA-115845 TaxID=3240071 RepID=UPI003D94160A
MRITDSTALVTGGASGLGLATARRLLDDGARVVIADLPTSDGAAAAARIGAVFAPTDVTSEADVRATIAAATGLGPLRAVVNCAGIPEALKVLDRSGQASDLERFRRTVSVNLVGTFNVIRLAAEAMIGNEPVDGDRGVVVCTSSVAAFDGTVGQAAYAASKAAVAGMTLPIAREFAEHAIRVVSIAPGMFETPLFLGLPENAQRSLAAQVPHPPRMGRPAEFADCVSFIVGNPMINGETLRLDGAIRMAPR